MKKTLLLLIAILIAQFVPATGQLLKDRCISVADAIANVYDPSTKVNYKNKPVIIITYLISGSKPAARGYNYLQTYRDEHNIDAEYVLVDIETSPNKDWIDKMDIAATGKKLEEYVSPLFYFINTDGTVKRFSGFSKEMMTDSDKRSGEFRSYISNLR